MKKFLLVLVVAALAGGGYYFYQQRKNAAARNPVSEQPPPLPQVDVVRITTEEVTITQELNGRVTPHLIAEVRPQVNGIILKRLFEEGSDVTEGMQLYQIDPAMYDAELNRANATLARAKANVDVAEAKLARYRRLIEARAVNQQEYDEVEAASKQAQADVGIAEAEVRVAKINVDYAKVLSPISGRIGKSSVTQGALVTASQADPLAVVQKLDPIYVDVSQPISWMAELREDMQAGILSNTGQSYGEMRLKLDNGRIYGERGKLLFADVTVDRTTGSISLRAEFPNPNHELLPGMFVIGVLDVAQKEDAVVVPARALSREPDGTPFVLVVAEDGTVERRQVVTLRTLGTDRWLIGDGLREGETVVVSGGQRLRFTADGPAPKVKPLLVE